nr:TIGR01244 family sulfur transferase [uncultured Sphingomonas sp.]
MDVRPISPNVWVSGQILPSDLPTLKEMGFRAIIGNRPDGEEADQPKWSDISEAAEQAGLAVAHIPITPGHMTSNEVLEFRDAVTGFEKPVLAFCRTGTRSAQLWAFAARDRLSTDEVIRMAATAGYDISGLQEKLETAGPSASA